MRGTGTFSMDVVGFCRTIFSCRTIASLRNFSIPDVNSIAFLPDFKVIFIRFDQLIQIAFTFFGNILFELVTVKTTPTAPTQQKYFGRFVQIFINGVNKIC